MKIHRLTMTGVGPFHHEQTIDFDEVAASGLFLIEGPTGSGKTTIIDSIVFALFGTVSGKESDVSRMRSNLCEPGEPSEVCLEFSVRDKRYVLRRSPKFDRPKARGEGLTAQAATQTLEISDGTASRDAKEIAGHLYHALGLTAEQFRRLVVLPQGEFDVLLRSSPKDRYEVLASLIDDGFLAKVQEDLKARADAALAQRAEADQRLADVIGLIVSRAAEVEGELPDGQGPSADDTAAFDPEAMMDRVATAAAAAAIQVETLATPLEDARRAALEATQAAHAARDAVTARSRVRAAEASLALEDAGLDGDGMRTRQTELVAQRTRLEPFARWEEDAPARAEHARQLADAVSKAQASAESARQDAQTLPARRAAAEEEVTQARIEAARVDDLATEITRLNDLTVLFTRQASLTEETSKALLAKEKTAGDLHSARERLHQARTDYHTLVQRQLDQRAAHLASLLVEGQPCPVCGSDSHPAPATSGHAGTALVTDDDVAEAQDSVTAAEAGESEARAAHESATQHHSTLAIDVASVDAQVGQHTPQTVIQALLVAQTAHAQALGARDSLNALASARDDVETEAQSLARRLEQLQTALTQASSAQDSFADQVSREQDNLLAEVGPEKTATSALAEVTARVNALTTVQTAREAAAGLPVDVDVEAALDRARVAEEAKEALTLEHDAAVRRRTSLDSATRALRGYLADLTAARDALAQVSEGTETAIALGALVTGHGNANVRRLTLQAYAVQRRFRSVLEAATVHLERMSSGRFSFELAEEGGRGLTGLGISLRETWTNTLRDPATMSGGETFYASLSLALGLADVVREEAGGADLQTLFVDEGFGSLDTDTLTVVLDQLDALRSRGRTVGVVSHVTEMKDWVHDRIEVIPGRKAGDGSTLRQS